jgi:hypothetical protein
VLLGGGAGCRPVGQGGRTIEQRLQVRLSDGQRVTVEVEPDVRPVGQGRPGEPGGPGEDTQGAEDGVGLVVAVPPVTPGGAESARRRREDAVRRSGRSLVLQVAFEGAGEPSGRGVQHGLLGRGVPGDAGDARHEGFVGDRKEGADRVGQRLLVGARRGGQQRCGRVPVDVPQRLGPFRVTWCQALPVLHGRQQQGALAEVAGGAVGLGPGGDGAVRVDQFELPVVAYDGSGPLGAREDDQRARFAGLGGQGDGVSGEVLGAP